MNIKGIFKKKVTCEYCGKPVNEKEVEPWLAACHECHHKIPAALMKACHDSFFYAAYVRNLGIVEFYEAKIDGEWVWLKRDSDYGIERETLPYPFERGVEVRLSDIVWCADAPNGS